MASLQIVARYGISTFGKSLLWAMIEVYALYSLTDLLHFPTASSGALLLGLLLWSAIADVQVGRIVDQHLGPAATNRMMRWCAPLAGLSFVLGLVPIAGAAGPAIALIAAMLFRPLYSMIDVPHNALLHDLDTGRRGRMRLAVVRQLSGTIAAFVVSLAAMLMLAPASGVDEVAAFWRFAALIAIGGTACFLVTPGLRGVPTTLPTDTKERVAGLLRDRDVMSVCAATMLGVIGFSLFSKSLPYVAQYRFADLRWSGDALLMINLGKLAALLLWPIIAGRSDARRASIAAYALCVPATALFAGRGLVLDISLIMIGFAMGGAGVLSWALVAGLVERLRDQEGRRVQSSLFGLFTSLSKVALGAGGSLLGLLLSTNPGHDLGRLIVAIAAAFAICCALAGGTLLLRSRPPSKSSPVRGGGTPQA